MLSIIFPAYNEAASLRRFTSEVFPVFDELGEPYEIVIVDDGSRDDTANVARSLGERVRLVQHERNRGLGAALRTGISAAKGDLVVTMDADLTFAPALVAPMLERFRRGDVDVVSGSPKLAGYGSEIPSYRILISRLSTVIYSLILGRRITAVSPILRLYRREHVTDLPLRAEGFEINAEILFMLIQRGARIAEIPTPLTQRLHGETKLRYRREIARHLRLTRRILTWRLRNGVAKARP